MSREIGVILKIRGLHATGWRNLAPLDLRFDSGARIHVLAGDNGQGKTNIIEALYYLAALRSFRTTRASDLVQKGKLEARIAADVEGRDLVRSIAVQLSVPGMVGIGDDEMESGAAIDSSEKGREGSPMRPAPRTITRLVSLDGKPVRAVSSAFGKLSVVLFVPEDLLLVRAPPAARRRFVDMAISGVEPAYFAEAALFQRVLRSRNAVLRAGRSPALPALLDTYDEQLARAGARLVIRRRRLIQALAPEVDVLFRRLHGNLPVRLTYISDGTIMSAGEEGEVAAALLTGMLKKRSLDERRGHTTFGPHTDDLEIHLGDRPAREHASQGQLRSLVLAMKLAELGHVESCRGEAPVLLLDDVPSELDPTRRRYLFETLAALLCQTVVSVADPRVVPPLAGRADFRVSAGVVAPG